jgi:hypothetical protein
MYTPINFYHSLQIFLIHGEITIFVTGKFLKSLLNSILHIKIYKSSNF